MVRSLMALIAVLVLQPIATAQAQEPTREANRAWDRGSESYRARDMEATRRHFTEACDGGHARACFNLGVMKRDGVGGGVDLEDARWRFSRACAYGNNAGCYSYGNMAMEAQGGERNDRDARDAHERACAGDVPQACNSLAILLEAGRGGVTDTDRARSLYDTSCKAGQASACENLAKLTGGAPAANSSLAQADYRMGLDYFNRRLYGNAYTVLRPFAEQGDAQAQYNVGWMLAYGQGTNRDYLDAARFLVAAARKGDRDAEAILTQIAPNVREAEFVYVIDTQGPDMSTLGNFAYEVEVYCRFGGQNCTMWKQRYQQAENANNRRAFSDQMRRAWTTQTTPRTGFGNDPRRGGETFSACIARQVRARGATAGSTLLDYDCY